MLTFKEYRELTEKVSSDILSKSGAGQEGTDELLNTYLKDTPYQKKAHKSSKEK
jgi:hypothetical protein